MKKILNIALDGPSGSGKSTVAKALSQKLNILYLDTGAMYRAVGVKAHSLGIDSFDEEGVKTFIDDIDLEIKYANGAQRTFLDGVDVSEKIREPYVSMLASNVSSLKCVRLKMVDMQRKIAKNMSCVLDGRDIGSYVLPDAEYKFYVTADSKVRTERRYKELTAKGFEVDFDTLHEEIKQRDYNDSHRDFSPLRQAEDAILVDTSNMSIEEVINEILSKII
jgi:cytidylate kinase